MVRLIFIVQIKINIQILHYTTSILILHDDRILFLKITLNHCQIIGFNNQFGKSKVSNINLLFKLNWLINSTIFRITFEVYPNHLTTIHSLDRNSSLTINISSNSFFVFILIATNILETIMQDSITYWIIIII